MANVARPKPPSGNKRAAPAASRPKAKAKHGVERQAAAGPEVPEAAVAVLAERAVAERVEAAAERVEVPAEVPAGLAPGVAERRVQLPPPAQPLQLKPWVLEVPLQVHRLRAMQEA